MAICFFINMGLLAISLVLFIITIVLDARKSAASLLGLVIRRQLYIDKEIDNGLFEEKKGTTIDSYRYYLRGSNVILIIPKFMMGERIFVEKKGGIFEITFQYSLVPIIFIVLCITQFVFSTLIISHHGSASSIPSGLGVVFLLAVILISQIIGFIRTIVKLEKIILIVLK